MKRRVPVLRLPDGTLTGQEDLILQQFEVLYTDLYSVEKPDPESMETYLDSALLPQIPLVTSTILDKDITPSEVLMAIHCLQMGKAPGFDDFEAEFYKTFGTQLAPVLARLYNTLAHLAPSPLPRCN
ncbi:hypothetical protein NDU88_001657 [Pleurodeles waltl]|uniref:Uncharacterized protein n=1 Tax=Pleurodeles waltl TaxID=8319 RepID=A0AAV7VY90_PLEWA|nr:hypothetical protein NDU88_001657 [Pleurodeles waltl]